MSSGRRILLSPPLARDRDMESVVEAMKSGWLAPNGPDLDLFERELAEYLQVNHVVALSSGTAALHMLLKYVDVSDGDAVIVPTATFAATAFPITYLGAQPVFVDIDDSWNMHPELLDEALRSLRRKQQRVKAIVPVDLYGTPANYAQLSRIASTANVPLLMDSAEALGAEVETRKAGSVGLASAISFNGNKIITTSGGGAVATSDHDLAEKVRHWASQSRSSVPWYEHDEIGFNYRLSNLLAALGRAQLNRLDEEVARRRWVREKYREFLAGIEGVAIQEDPPWGISNAWLSVVRFRSALYPGAPEIVRRQLEENLIESRFTWKPMHQQPVFVGCPAYLNGAADDLFAEGLCLPSGRGLTEDDINRVAYVIKSALRNPPFE